MLAVVGPSQGVAHVHQFHGGDAQTGFLQPRDDLADQPTLYSVGLQ